MRQSHKNQEILLLTGSRYIIRELISHNSENRKENIPVHDKLERACWDGLLDNLLSGIVNDDNSKKEDLIWRITSSDSFLCINIGLNDNPKPGYSCINPYYFITSVNLS